MPFMPMFWLYWWAQWLPRLPQPIAKPHRIYPAYIKLVWINPRIPL